MDEEVKEVAAAVLRDNKVCGLATEGEEGPWVATTYYAEDGVNLYCLLTHGTKTITNIQKNPRVAYNIDNKQPITFIQGQGDVDILMDENEISKGKNLLLRKIPEIEPFMRQPNFSIVKISPKRLYLTDFSRGWFPAKVIDF